MTGRGRAIRIVAPALIAFGVVCCAFAVAAGLGGGGAQTGGGVAKAAAPPVAPSGGAGAADPAPDSLGDTVAQGALAAASAPAPAAPRLPSRDAASSASPSIAVSQAEPQPAPAVDTSDADHCDFLDPAVCLQPWPNDYFTRPDGDTATGRRLALDLRAMPRNVEGKPIDPTPYNRADGFSPGSPIETKVPGLDTPQAFANTGAVPITDMARYADRDQPIVVIDTTTLRRWPVWSELDANASDPKDVNLIIRPAVNFAEGHRYVVALRNLEDAAGSTIEAQAGFRVYRDRTPTDDPAIEQRRAHMEDLFRTLRRAGIARKDLYLAWDFTVGSERSIAGRELWMRDDAFGKLGDTNLADLQVAGRAPDFTVDKVTDYTPDQDARIARRVEGRVTVPCYLNLPGCPPGSTFLFAPGSDTPTTVPGNTTEARYVCDIPRSTVDGAPSRPSLYGHGLFGSRFEIGQSQLKAFGNDYDITFCATDWIGMACADIPNGVDVPPSGVPSPADLTGLLNDAVGAVQGGHAPYTPNCDIPVTATALLDLSNFPTLTDRMQQAFLNFMYLGRAMIHPDGFDSNPAFQVGADHHGVFQTGRLYYDGNSQGGIAGGGLIALEPDLDRGVLGVPAMNYSTLLTRSSDFGQFSQILYPNYPNQLERPLIFSLIQLLWDRAEADGYARHMTTDPLPNTPAHHVLMHLAFGDHQVANVAAETEARTIGALARTPYVNPGRSPYVTDTPWGLPAIPGFPFDGSGIVMWDSGSPPAPTTNTPPTAGHDPHEDPRNSPLAREQKSAFLEPGGDVIDVCPPGAGCVIPPA